MFPNHLNFYFNYKISGDTSGESVYPKIDDKLIFSRGYPGFSRNLILNIIHHAGNIVSKRRHRNRNGSLINNLLHVTRENTAARNYVNGVKEYIYHKVFWTIVFEAFKDINAFDRYLKRKATLNYLDGYHMCNVQDEYCFQQFDIKKC